MSGKRYINPYKLFVGSFMPNWLVKRDELSPQAKIIYARLCQYGGERGDVYPSQAVLAIDTGISERHVRNMVEELIGYRLIEVDARGHGRQNVYRFIEHDWMEFDRNCSSSQSLFDRNCGSGQNPPYIKVEVESLNTHAGKPRVASKNGKPKKVETPEQSERRRVKGEWFGYAKAAYSEKYPGYVFTGRQDAGLSRIFEQVCGRDPVKSRAFLQCALADTDPFLANQRHDPTLLASKPNKWLTACRGWHGFKPESPSEKVEREKRRREQLAEQDRHRREAEELERVEADLSALSEGDLETLRAAWLSTVPGDHIFRSKWAEADWRTTPVVMAGIYGALKERRLRNAGGVP